MTHNSEELVYSQFRREKLDSLVVHLTLHPNPLPSSLSLSSDRHFSMNLPILASLWLLNSASGNSWDRSNPDAPHPTLKGLLQHAYRASPFYRARMDECGLGGTSTYSRKDLQRLAVLEKQMLRDHLDEIVCRDVPIQKLKMSKTTGSTGFPLALPTSNAEYLFELYAWHRIYMAAGLHPHLRQVKFFMSATESSAPERTGFGGCFRRWRISAMCSPAAKVECLKRVRPHAVFGLASVLGEIAQELERRQETLPIPLVFSTSDMLWDNLRAQIKARLGADPFDAYGTVETGPLAWKCRADGTWILNCGWVILEILDSQGQPAKRGRVVCTVLWRRTVPLIRYALGDIAEWADPGTGRGQSTDRLARLHGRENELLRLPNGETVSASQLNAVVRTMPGIRQFQIVQESEGQLRYQLETNADYPADGDRQILARFRERFRDALAARIVHVDSIPRAPGAKFSPFVGLDRNPNAKVAP